MFNNEILFFVIYLNICKRNSTFMLKEMKGSIPVCMQEKYR